MKNLTLQNLKVQSTHKQQGAVLVMALMMLFVLTLIGVSSISTTSMEEKMSGNTRNRHLAFQAAESTVRDAERVIATAVNIVNPAIQFAANGGANGWYTLGNGPSNAQAVDPVWWAGNASSPYISQLQDVATPGRYTIEYLGQTGQAPPGGGIQLGNGGGPAQRGFIQTFRVTARGTGLTDNSVVVIQSHFAP